MAAESPVQQKQALQHPPTEDRPEGRGPNQLYTRQSVQGQSSMNRLYAVEGTPSVTGNRADHRIRVRTSDVPAFAAQLAQALGAGSGAAQSNLPDKAAKAIAAIARALHAHRGSGLVIAGEYQPAAV